MFSETLSHLNWLHVLVAAIGYFALGSIWYSPILFAKPWVKYSGINMADPNAKKGVGAIMFGSFIMMLIATIGLALMLQLLPAINVLGGIKEGILVGVCFSTTAISVNYLYNKKPLPLYFIDCIYHIIGLAIAGAILAGWR
ncbi:DUF1761 domain-containing protein [Chitinophagaceae bacterium LWZ2-11]